MSTAGTRAAAEDPIDDGRCFACGMRNDHGLRLRFVPDGEHGVRGETALRAVFQGWQGVAHGGIVMTLLDEAMAHAAGRAGYRGVTAGVRVRFRRPVPLETPLLLRGRVRSLRRNVLKLEASVSDANGTLLAAGEGDFVAKGAIEPGKLGNPDLLPGG
jgi:uncharacterized protein (TIGR00369 family)